MSDHKFDDRMFKSDGNTAPEPVASAEEWQNVLDLALSRMGCQTGTIHRLEPGTRLLKLVAARGIPEELMPKVGTIPIGKGIAGAAAERREPVQICNLQTDDGGGVARPDAKKTNVAGSVAIPILDGDELVGTVGVGKFMPHEFSESETAELEKIAAWLAKAFRVSF